MADDFKLRTVLIYQSENSRPLRIRLDLLCLYSIKMEQQSLDDSTFVYNIVD